MRKFSKKIVVLIFVFFVLGCLAVGGLAYFGPDGSFSVGILRSLQLPIALSSGQTLTVDDLEVKNKVRVSSRAEIGKALTLLHADLLKSNILKHLNLSEKHCQSLEMSVDDCLKYAWFLNSSTTSISKNKASVLAGQIRAGASVQELAKLTSQDEATKQFNGDSGYVRVSEVLPEFAEGLTKLKVGEVGVVPSRHGLHIFKMEEVVGGGDATQESFYRFREIFLEVPEYDAWLQNELKNSRLMPFVY